MAAGLLINVAVYVPARLNVAVSELPGVVLSSQLALVLQRPLAAVSQTSLAACDKVEPVKNAIRVSAANAKNLAMATPGERRPADATREKAIRNDRVPQPSAREEVAYP